MLITMRNQRGEDIARLTTPELFPLFEPAFRQYAQSGNVYFGWRAANGEVAGRLTVSKWKWSGGSAVIADWPLTEEGWGSAWSYMRTEQPALAKAVAENVSRDSDKRAAVMRRAEGKALLDAEGPLDVLRGCVLLGGYGLESGVHASDKVDIYFTGAGIWVTKAGGFRAYLRRSYGSSHALEFSGGAIQRGGGYLGGGVGLIGAAEGIAISRLLNSLTTKTSVHTTIRFEADDAEVFFFTDKAVPGELEIRFANVRGHIKRGRPAPSTTPATGGDFSERLLRLGEMLDKGQLTAEEFKAAKARLFQQGDQ